MKFYKTTRNIDKSNTKMLSHKKSNMPGLVHGFFTRHKSRMTATVFIAAFASIGVYMLYGSFAEIIAPSITLPTAPLGKTWQVAFSDEFNGTSLDTSKWETHEPWQTSPGYEESPDSYCPLPDNSDVVVVENGHLDLKALRGSNPENKPLKSCFVTTRNSFNTFTSGYAEARVKVPSEAGLWPAFWLLGNGTWPATGEIDVFEFVNTGSPNDTGTPYFTVHWQGDCWGIAGNHCQKSFHWPAKVSNYTDWHTFGVLRSTDAVKIYIDGQYAYEMNPGMKSDDDIVALPSSPVFTDPMHIRFDLQAGGWANNPSQGSQPGDFLIDYVRVWQLGDQVSQDSTPPTTPTALVVNTPTKSSLSLSWSPSTDNIGVSSYRIYRNGTLIASPSATSYVDSGLTASTTYSYTVSAVDTSGNASNQSTAVSATTSPNPVAKKCDINNDTHIDSKDLSILLANYNKTVTINTKGDCNGSYNVDSKDLFILLGNWGK